MFMDLHDTISASHKTFNQHTHLISHLGQAQRFFTLEDDIMIIDHHPKLGAVQVCAYAARLIKVSGDILVGQSCDRLEV